MMGLFSSYLIQVVQKKRLMVENILFWNEDGGMKPSKYCCSRISHIFPWVVFPVFGLCLCLRYHFPSSQSRTKFIMQFTVPALPFPSCFCGTAEEVCLLEKWECYLALSSDLMELGQSGRPNSYKQISKGKSTLRKYLVCNQADKCDNTAPVRKGLEDSFPIHLC